MCIRDRTVTLSENNSIASDIIEAGLGYEGEFSGVALKAGANYIAADAFDGDIDPGVGVITIENVSAWSLGAQAAYNGFTFGGGYTDDGDSLQATSTADNNVTSWNVGATYENGPWGVGVSYLNTDFDTNAVAKTLTAGGVGGDYSVVATGATYKVAPGLAVGADLSFYDRNAIGTADDDSGYVLLTDVTAAF